MDSRLGQLWNQICLPQALHGAPLDQHPPNTCHQGALWPGSCQPHRSALLLARVSWATSTPPLNHIKHLLGPQQEGGSTHLCSSCWVPVGTFCRKEAKTSTTCWPCETRHLAGLQPLVEPWCLCQAAQIHPRLCSRKMAFQKTLDAVTCWDNVCPIKQNLEKPKEEKVLRGTMGERLWPKAISRFFFFVLSMQKFTNPPLNTR